jgi:HemY protein
MTRILIFLLWLVMLAGTITILMTFDSRISGEAFGLTFDSPSWFVIGALVLFFLLTIYVTHKIKDILALPAKIRAKDSETKRERGVAALTRGLEAVAVGDAADASHHAKVAQKHLHDLSLTRLLTAQAAQLSGDEEAAGNSFSAMLDAPETEFLGLKGLYAQAIKRGDQREAREYAERAFSLRANAGWAFQSVVDLGLERGAWGETRDAIAKGKRNNLISTEKADRATAALLTADAYAAHASDDQGTALSEAEAALKLAAAFAPAATLAAELNAAKGKTARAASTIEAAFAKEPHPALIRAYDKIYADEPVEKRAEKLNKLAAKNPDTQEAAFLEARAANLIGEHATAMAKLEPLITKGPDAHAYALMATAAAGLHGEAVGKGWLERAAGAPRDPRPGADGAFHFTRAGWARLVREFMDHGRLAPPPLEDVGQAITADELRLLTAPPPPEVEPADNTLDEEDGQAEETPRDQKTDDIPVTEGKSSVASENEKPDEDDGAAEAEEDAKRAIAAARSTP